MQDVAQKFSDQSNGSDAGYLTLSKRHDPLPLLPKVVTLSSSASAQRKEAVDQANQGQTKIVYFTQWHDLFQHWHQKLREIYLVLDAQCEELETWVSTQRGTDQNRDHPLALLEPATNYYERLGIRPNATTGDITKAYRKKARETHPDRPGGNQERFKRIDAAYKTLKDPEKRGQFDATLKRLEGLKDDPNDLKTNVDNKVLRQRISNSYRAWHTRLTDQQTLLFRQALLSHPPAHLSPLTFDPPLYAITRHTPIKRKISETHQRMVRRKKQRQRQHVITAHRKPNGREFLLLTLTFLTLNTVVGFWERGIWGGTSLFFLPPLAFICIGAINDYKIKHHITLFQEGEIQIIALVGFFFIGLLGAGLYSAISLPAFLFAILYFANQYLLQTKQTITKTEDYYVEEPEDYEIVKYIDDIKVETDTFDNVFAFLKERASKPAQSNEHFIEPYGLPETINCFRQFLKGQVFGKSLRRWCKALLKEIKRLSAHPSAPYAAPLPCYIAMHTIATHALAPTRASKKNIPHDY